ncbi:MAG: lipoyl(octanoyl) transferase LipB [Pseudomonadota bacterium]|nr:MAG: lipoyl(octanoyl) transferase LipB [Pseudomonadota bacterium]
MNTSSWPSKVVGAPTPATGSPVVRRLGVQPYVRTWRAMQEFTAQRRPDTPDELWVLEHPPIYTLGLNGRDEHVLNAADVPLIKVDRGGQVTYHGPGQVVVYVLCDLGRSGLGVRHLVTRLETAVIDTLAQFGIAAHSRTDAPGVYVDEAKIAALGLRVRRGCSYHGLALNVAMDLEPFARINPCGHAGMPVTQVSDLGGPAETAIVSDTLLAFLVPAID